MAKISDYDPTSVRVTLMIPGQPPIMIPPADVVSIQPAGESRMLRLGGGPVFRRGQVVVAEPCAREVRAGGRLYLGTGQWCRWCGRATVSPTSCRCRACNARQAAPWPGFAFWPLCPAALPDNQNSSDAQAEVDGERLGLAVRAATAAFGSEEPEDETDWERADRLLREEHVLRVREHARHAAQCEVDRQRFTTRRIFTALFDGGLETCAAAAAAEVLQRHDLHTEFGIRVRAGEVELVFPGGRRPCLECDAQLVTRSAPPPADSCDACRGTGWLP